MLRVSLVVAALAAAFAPLSAALVEERFSTGIYPHLQRSLTTFSNAFPFALLDVLSLAAAAWLCWVWWRALRRKGTPLWRRLGGAAASTVTGAAVVYLAFLLSWGLNYRRVPLPDRLVLERAAPTTEGVFALGREAVGRLNGIHAEAHTSGLNEAPWRNGSLREAFREAQLQLADAAPAVPGRLKGTLYGAFFRWTGVDGMVNPFGLEVLRNPDLLPFEVPFVAAHEWGHLAGYADESEANFVGWLTCIRADVASQYSGWLYLYWQIAGELPAEYRTRLASELAAGPRADLEAITARLRRGDLPLLRRASWMMYDSYLKANQVEEGVRSYGAVVTLILRARFADDWRPVRRPAAP